MMLQNLLLSSTFFSLLSIFPFSCWYTLFLSSQNKLLFLYCSILCSYLLILVVLTCILCFSSSRTTSDTFFLTLYLCSITLYFCFFLISSRLFLSKMLICFCNSFTDCFILSYFHHGTFTAFPLLWFGLRATFFPTKMKHALINLLVSII